MGPDRERPFEMDRSPERQGEAAPPSTSRATATVVVGVDGSDTSWDAFWWACGEARRLGGRAVVVFVSPFAGAGVASAASDIAAVAAVDFAVRDGAARSQADELREEVARYATDHGIELTFVHARGDAAAELLRVAVAEHADQIVVGRSTKARHHLAGSLGRRLVGKRTAPVVVVVP